MLDCLVFELSKAYKKLIRRNKSKKEDENKLDKCKRSQRKEKKKENKLIRQNKQIQYQFRPSRPKGQLQPLLGSTRVIGSPN